MSSLGVALMLMLLMAVVGTSTAQADHGAGVGITEITCTHVTWTYTGFANANNNEVTQWIYVNGVVVSYTTFTFNGPSGSDTVNFTVPPGKYNIDAKARWNTNGVVGNFDHHGLKMKCEPPPLPPAFSTFPDAFTSKSSESYFEASGQRVICKHDENTGEITGSKTGKLTITYVECKNFALNAPCQNTANSGEIVVTNLVIGLGYIKEVAPLEVGMSLAPEAGGPFVELECAGVKIVVGEGKATEGGKEGGDSVISGKTFSRLNTPVLRAKLEHHCVAGKQQFEKFETGPLDVLEAKIGEGPWEEACLNSNDNLVFEEPESVIT